MHVRTVSIGSAPNLHGLRNVAYRFLFTQSDVMEPLCIRDVVHDQDPTHLGRGKAPRAGSGISTIHAEGPLAPHTWRLLTTPLVLVQIKKLGLAFAWLGRLARDFMGETPMPLFDRISSLAGECIQLAIEFVDL